MTKPFICGHFPHDFCLFLEKAAYTLQASHRFIIGACCLAQESLKDGKFPGIPEGRGHELKNADWWKSRMITGERPTCTGCYWFWGHKLLFN